MSSRDRRSPAILRCSAGSETGGSAGDTCAACPAGTSSRANASSDRPSSPGSTMQASSTTLSTALITAPFARTVTLDSAWKPAARTTAQSRCR